MNRRSMLTSQRKQLILDALKRDGQVIAKSLSNEFGVSEDTVRRDLRELAADGYLQRVHGGALPSSPAAADLAGRQGIESASKAAIGRAAAQMIEPGQIVIVDGGTTAVQLVRHLPLDLRATIVTHSPGVAVELAHHRDVEVIMIGGRLYRHSMVNVGAAAIEALSHIRADLYFMGVTGVHPEAGLSTGDLEEAYVKRALAARAAETVVLASAEKLNTASAFMIAEASAAHALVVEKETSETLTAPFEALGIAIVRA
jgi:DeoR/GlpR family transcriptional regulator of sugar metabolism